jgi:hypothetical protein
LDDVHLKSFICIRRSLLSSLTVQHRYFCCCCVCTPFLLLIHKLFAIASDQKTKSCKLYCNNLAWSLPAVLVFDSATACSVLTGRAGQQHGPD